MKSFRMYRFFDQVPQRCLPVAEEGVKSQKVDTPQKQFSLSHEAGH